MYRHVYPTLIPIPSELIGERVTLRPLRPTDGPAMQEAIDESRAEIEVWMDWPPMMRTQDDAVDYCIRMAAEWLRRDSLNVGVFETATGRYLGGTGFHTISWRIRTFEIGYWLRTSAAGQGYMTEAVRLLIGLAFDRLDARRVSILCDTRNTKSRAIPERLGFVLEGTHRKDSLTPSGEPRDTLVFALTDDDYQTLREQGATGQFPNGRG